MPPIREYADVTMTWKMTWMTTLTLMTLLLHAVDAAPRIAVDASDDDEAGEIIPEPWRINQVACPPSLCGPPPASHPGMPSNMLSSPRAYPFFEGDIIREGRPRHERRNIIRPITRLWKYGQVPFVIDDEINEDAKKYIKAAFRHYERHTCLRFQRKTKEDENYLHYISDPGCWSHVGMVGGQQYISIGRGCEHFGTVVHETGHALGFWHTQSRRDRDEYVDILWENISPSAFQQFDARDTTEVTTRGFVYDYQSIMHYGDDYFSKNGKSTIRVKGVGAKMGYKVGQRRGLSDLDITLINSMYYCNNKHETERACGPGEWIEYDGACYQFHRSPQLSDTKAENACRDTGAQLLVIEKANEDEFIKDFLVTHHPNSKAWRTGGRFMDSRAVWSSPRGQTQMQYTAWPTGYTPDPMWTLVLDKMSDSSTRFDWQGVRAGANHSYICEKKIFIECVSPSTKGRDYRGDVSYTAQAVTCQYWNSMYPHEHRYITGDTHRDDVINGLGDHNFCRNPDGAHDRPWCFTTLAETRWQYCDLKLCS